MKAVFLHIILILFCAKLSYAQDPQFSQPYASPLYLNPALTGDTKKNRLALTYRKQWAEIEKGFTSYIASYDHYEERLNSGFGGYVLYDQSGLTGYRVTGISLNYSYDVRIDDWSGIKGGLGLGYSFMSYNVSDLVFADQIIRNGASTSVETNLSSRTSYADMSAGVLYYNKSFWAGASVSHLNKPNISMTNQVQQLPMKFSLQTGAKLWKKKNEWGHELSSLNLAAHYQFQGSFDQLDIGVYYNFNPVVFGVWYRGIPLVKSYEANYANHESVILLLGVEYKDFFRVAYSYDITVSQLSLSSGGSHEISLIYEWPGKKKPNRMRMVACPRF